MKSSGTITLLNLETVQSDNTGYRSFVVTSKRAVNCENSEVGMNTYWSSRSMNINLSKAFLINRRMYSGENYVSFRGEPYSIQNVGKGDSDMTVRLNASDVEDADAKEAILNAMASN